MSEQIKTILISQFPLPYHKIGSWTKMYNYYLEHFDNEVDILICPEPREKVKNIEYHCFQNSNVDKLKAKVSKEKFHQIHDILKNILKDEEKYILQIIDNQGLANSVHELLERINKRDNVHVQFFYHGFPPFFGNFQSREFFNAIDEHIQLTHASYEVHRQYYSILPCVFNVLHNGIDSDKFFALKPEIKKERRKEIGLSEEANIFLWCSKDIPKKGLDLLLKFWKKVIINHPNSELWIIGSNRDIKGEKIKNFGVVENHKIPDYLQLADFYLFTSLCEEGFPMSLLEALKCGCYCIGSNRGGIAELLGNGQYGKLIDRPNFLQDWISEIDISVQAYNTNNRISPYHTEEIEKLYDIKTWSLGMNKLINDAKSYL